MADFEGVQLDILNSNANTQLISAGAGSGKTTIMIKKLTNLIVNDNVDVDNLLVVTFTVLAAQEMKDRLIQSLIKEAEKSDNKDKIFETVEKLKTASIDTFDGFNSKTIKKYFYALEVSPNTEIITDSTKDYWMVRAMEKTFDTASEDDLLLLLDLYGGNSRNFDTIKKTIIEVYTKISNEINIDEFLIQSENEYKGGGRSETVVNKFILGNVRYFLEAARDANIFGCTAYESILDSITSLNSINENLMLKQNLQMLFSYKPTTITKKQIEQYPELEDIKDAQLRLTNFIKKIKDFGLDTNFDEKNTEILKYFEIFVKILKSFVENYNDIKAKNNLVDFTDLNKLMIKLLDNEVVLKELQDKYKYIFIDEYQDVNPMQDCLMAKLTTEDTKLFMVGDLKQSIYGFRGSSPEMFLDRYTDIKQAKNDGDVFDMNVNFRSGSKILSFINDVFSKLMTPSSSDIDFKTDCHIEARRDDIPNEKVRIALFNKNTIEESKDGVYSVVEDQGVDTILGEEEKYIVSEIENVIGKEFYDPSLRAIRTIEYSDIAILSQTEKSDKVLSLISELKRHNIPVNSNSKFDIHCSESLSLIKSILKCVQNEADDVDYMACFLAITDLTIDDFVDLRDKENSLFDNLISSSNPKVKEGFDKLNQIKVASFTRSNKGLIKYILDDMKLRYFILKMTLGEKELYQLNMYIDSISSYEDNLGLSDFLDVISSGVNSEATFNVSDSQNSVTIQTIHKSKGLEYPIVFLFDSFKENRNTTDLINYNSNIGLGVDYFDMTNRTKSGSLVKFANSLLNEEKTRKEKLRLLYVAMTRAKNRLYITGTLSKSKPSDNGSFLSMILSCYNEFDFESDLSKDNVIIQLNPQTSVAKEECEHQSEIVTRIEEDFVYPNLDKFDIVFKNTVTGINSSVAVKDGYHIKDITKPSVQYNAEEITSMGTHYHKALELCDFSSEYKKNTDFEDVDYSLIEKAHSVFYARVKDCEIKKEAEFMMYVPYSEITDSNVADKVLIQGVVDLMLIYDEYIDIVDYKFSNLSVQSLKSKYSEQLKLYKMAVEKAYNKPVRNLLIYSIKSGELG